MKCSRCLCETSILIGAPGHCQRCEAAINRALGVDTESRTVDRIVKWLRLRETSSGLDPECTVCGHATTDHPRGGRCGVAADFDRDNETDRCPCMRPVTLADAVERGDWR